MPNRKTFWTAAVLAFGVLFSSGAAIHQYGTAAVAPAAISSEISAGISADISGRFADWALSAYNQPQLSWNTDGLSIRGSGTPAGVYFHRRLARDESYRLTVKGSNAQGTANLRLRKNGGDPKWLGAPNGEKIVFLSATDEVEILIYADAAFEFSLDSLSLERVSHVPTDEALKAAILLDRPALAGFLERQQPLQAIEEIMQWTANAVSLGYHTGFSNINTTNIDEMSASESFSEVWQSNAGGGSCGSFAIFFAKVLDVFGFNAFIIDIGFEGSNLTHVTTVAAIYHDGKYRLHLFDPTFAATYKHRVTGDFLSLEDVVDMQNSGVKAFTFFPSTKIVRRAFVPSDFYTRFMEHLNHTRTSAKCFPGTARNELMTICDDIIYSWDFLKPSWMPGLTARGMSDSDDLILFLVKGGIHNVKGVRTNGQSNAQAHKELLEVLVRINSPVGDARINRDNGTFQ